MSRSPSVSDLRVILRSLKTSGYLFWIHLFPGLIRATIPVVELFKKMSWGWRFFFWLLLSVGPLPAQTTAPDPQWEREIAAFELRDKTDPPPVDGILFVVSSSIRKWTTLAADFPGLPVYNRGFGGSQLIDSVRYANRIVLPYKPKMIVLYAGTNDIAAGKSVDQVFSDFQEFTQVVRARLPKTKIAYIACAPNPKRWSMVDKFEDLNRRIADYVARQDNMVFIDVFPRMLGSDGCPLPDLFVEDNLHMNPKGYALWTEIVKPYLQ